MSDNINADKIKELFEIPKINLITLKFNYIKI